jgi:uncharacterized membrane protein
MNVYLLYIAISIIGSMLPFFEKKFLKILDVSEFLALRWIIVIFYLFYIDIGGLYKKIMKMSMKDKGLLLLYPVLMLGMLNAIMYVIKYESDKHPMSNIVALSMVITIILVFCIDQFIMKQEFTLANMFGLLFIVIGIIMTRLVK